MKVIVVSLYFGSDEMFFVVDLGEIKLLVIKFDLGIMNLLVIMLLIILSKLVVVDFKNLLNNYMYFIDFDVFKDGIMEIFMMESYVMKLVLIKVENN